MKLLRVHIISAPTCGGLLDGVDIQLRELDLYGDGFEPICFVGPNGSGKSQFLQIIAEVFQSIFHAVATDEERLDGNPELQFEVEYEIEVNGKDESEHVRVTRRKRGAQRPSIVIERKSKDKWASCDLDDPATKMLLPSKVVGYTSGDNETLSLPFLLSRGGYADEVATRALKTSQDQGPIQDTKLILIDYSTHLEVLSANLMLGDAELRASLLREANLDDIHSMRCVVQLAHSAVPKAPARLRKISSRKGIQLTDELETYIDRLQRCATCYKHDEKTDSYTFDFLIDEQSRRAFGYFWDSALELYSAFHKLSMLNDLAISRTAREKFKKDTLERRFASRLPEPTDDDTTVLSRKRTSLNPHIDWSSAPNAVLENAPKMNHRKTNREYRTPLSKDSATKLWILALITYPISSLRLDNTL